MLRATPDRPILPEKGESSRDTISALCRVSVTVTNRLSLFLCSRPDRLCAVLRSTRGGSRARARLGNNEILYRERRADAVDATGRVLFNKVLLIFKVLVFGI